MSSSSFKNEVTEVYQIVEVSVENPIPDGSYGGIKGGYEVKFRVRDRSFKAKTTLGVRGMNIPCVVTVQDGEIVVT